MRKSSGKGIRKRRMIKPYRTSIDGRNRYFATVEEAVAARDTYRARLARRARRPRRSRRATRSAARPGRPRRPSKAKATTRAAQAEAKATARAALKDKRDRNLELHGHSIAHEREFALALVAAWKAATGLSALVLNDGTVADVLLLRKEDAWLRVQVKTVGAPINDGRAWNFHAVVGYPGMPVVCWRRDHGDGWVFDGDDLDERGKEGLVITPGFKNCRLALGRNLKLSSLVTWLQKNASRWPTVTEYDARHQFRSESQRLEMQGIDAFKERWPEPQYSWPDGAHTQVDLIMDGKRLQFKTASRQQRGYTCTMRISAGHDKAGRKLYDPYPAGSFDMLIAVAWEDGIPHFWIIPASTLEDRGVMSSEMHAGQMSLRLHSPTIGNQPSQTHWKKADTWSSTFFVSPP